MKKYTLLLHDYQALAQKIIAIKRYRIPVSVIHDAIAEIVCNLEDGVIISKAIEIINRGDKWSA